MLLGTAGPELVGISTSPLQSKPAASGETQLLMQRLPVGSSRSQPDLFLGKKN